MKTKIIKIGNSQGIRIPKAIIEQCGLNESIEMKVIDGGLVLTPTQVRAGWEEYFQEMAANGEDELLIDDAILTAEDEDWEW